MLFYMRMIHPSRSPLSDVSLTYMQNTLHHPILLALLKLLLNIFVWRFILANLGRGKRFLFHFSSIRPEFMKSWLMEKELKIDSPKISLARSLLQIWTNWMDDKKWWKCRWAMGPSGILPVNRTKWRVYCEFHVDICILLNCLTVFKISSQFCICKLNSDFLCKIKILFLSHIIIVIINFLCLSLSCVLAMFVYIWIFLSFYVVIFNLRVFDIRSISLILISSLEYPLF